MKILVNKTNFHSIPSLGSQKKKGEVATVLAKFFCPTDATRYYATEYDADNRVFFGLIVKGSDIKLDYFGFDDSDQNCHEFQPVLQDLSFKPAKLEDVRKLHTKVV